jgi:hypothetical protein
MCPFRENVHQYGFYELDDDGNWIPPEKWDGYLKNGSAGFSPGLPDWLPQPTFDALVKREYERIDKPVATTVVRQGKGNYEIKRYPNSAVAHNKISVVRNLFKRLWRRIRV